jgi:hypothetical protein
MPYKSSYHKLILLLLWLAHGNFTAMAQSSTETSAQSVWADGKHRFGLHVTPNFSWVSPETRLLNTASGGFGYGYGLLIERRIGSNYFFSTGLNFNQLEYNSGIDSTIFKLPNGNPLVSYDPNYTYRVQYAELPLSMKMRTNQIGALRIYGQFGVNVGFLMRARAAVTNVPAVFDPEEFFFINRTNDYRFPGDNTVDDRVNFFRASVLIGAGIEYLLSGDTHLTLGLRFDNPFTDSYRGDKLNGRVPTLGLQVGVIF